jgi:ribosomal protein S18 acetylase RimI-like enzyme
MVRGEGTVRIRRLRVGDEGELVRSPTRFDEPADPGAGRDYLADPRNVFLMAYEGEIAVGFVRGTELGQLKSRQKQMFLYEIAVDERVRRRGVARALVEELLAYCRASGFEEAFVFTDPSNVAAVGLYRSTGAVTETPADRMFVYRLEPSR